MAIVVPSAWPLLQGMAAGDISYRQPILDASCQEIFVDSPTWAYAAGGRVAWEWAFGDIQKPLSGTIGAGIDIFRNTTFLGENRDECFVDIYAQNAKLVITAETPGGAVQDTLNLDTGAGAATVSGTLTGLTSGFILYKINIESSDGTLEAGISAFRFLENIITAGDLP
tara:strand:+ start:1573 stop:2079 length:507 start_codon:yes stop_codon:yes gene_type:complete